eukprot:scaffold30822_cov20-Cyclotella_meneghiniana.AAC.1
MPPKYWKDHEAAYVANVVKETAALPSRKRTKKLPKGASPDKDTQNIPAPPKPKKSTQKKSKSTVTKSKQKKSKSTVTTTKSSSTTKSQKSLSDIDPPPPSNHADVTKDLPSDVADADSPSDVVVENRNGTSADDGEGGLFHHQDSDVEFDPIATVGPFEEAEEDNIGGEEVTPPPLPALTVGAIVNVPTPDTSATANHKDDDGACAVLTGTNPSASKSNTTDAASDKKKPGKKSQRTDWPVEAPVRKMCRRGGLSSWKA